MKLDFSSLPNLLTMLRLALIPVFVLLLINPTRGMVNAAIVIFILAALTDYADGYIARRFQLVSNFGKLLDPVADKILVMAALVMLVSLKSPLSGQSWVPGYLVVLALARELWVTGIRAVAAAHGKVVAADGTGKLKSVLQIIAIVGLLLHDRHFLSWGDLRISCQWVGLNFLLLSLLAAYWGAVGYTWQIFFADAAAESSQPSGDADQGDN